MEKITHTRFSLVFINDHLPQEHTNSVRAAISVKMMMLPCFDGFALTSEPRAVSFPTAALLRNFKHFRKGWQEKRFSVSTLCFLIHETAKISERDRPAGRHPVCWCAQHFATKMRFLKPI
jgi:hypothetical protein